MITASAVLKIAGNEVGYLEKKSASNLDDKTANAGDKNWTKYWRDLDSAGYQGQPWCDAFVKWCFEKAAGRENGKAMAYQAGKAWSYYTPASANYYKSAGKWSSTPHVGDQVFFKNAAGICHTGLVEKVEGGYVHTIEGNTSGASGVIANGGGVCRKKYQVGYSGIAGYGRPDYAAETVGEWVKSTKTDKWWFRFTDGTYPKSQWLLWKSKWYWFDEGGWMVSSTCVSIDGEWYAFDSHGALYQGGIPTKTATSGKIKFD